jgi:hypothetical protein
MSQQSGFTLFWGRLYFDRSIITTFFSANGAYAALLVGALNVESWRLQFVHHPAIDIFSIVVLECTTIIALGAIFSPRHRQERAGVFPDDPVVKFKIRFGVAEDFRQAEDVYHEWFPRSVSVDDAEFISILSRGYTARMVEVTHSSGKRQVVGYYTVWPISRATFDDLIEGKLKEKDLRASAVMPPNDSGATVLYIPEICATEVNGFGPQLLTDA